MTACAVLFFILTLRAMSKQAQTQIYVKNVEFLTAGYTIPRDRRDKSSLRRCVHVLHRELAMQSLEQLCPRARPQRSTRWLCITWRRHRAGWRHGKRVEALQTPHDAQSWQPQRPLAWLASGCSASWWQTERRFCWYLTFLCSIGECGATL